MQITKFTHSCLLLEDNGKTFLFDPGNYSYESFKNEILATPQIDYLLITHEHPDHFYLQFVKEILEKFPDIKIITTSSIKEQLAKENIEATNEEDELIKITTVPHEKVFGVTPPENILITANNNFAHPGDSFHFETSVKVLALPLQAPWGHTTEAVNLAESLKPEVIIPIHDWHWNDTARENIYKRLEDYFTKLGIKFISLEDCRPSTI